MKLGSVVINNMAANNQSLYFWFDIKFRKFWYVFQWRKRSGGPTLYRSTDGTPPTKREGRENTGQWYFGKGRDD